MTQCSVVGGKQDQDPHETLVYIDQIAGCHI